MKITGLSGPRMPPPSSGALLGAFRGHKETRDEFLALVAQNSTHV